MQLSRELGLAPRQIKFWFQNRITQTKVFSFLFSLFLALSLLQKRKKEKSLVFLLHRFFLQAQLKRADNCALKEENYRIRYENDVIREALKYATKTLTLMNRSFESKMLREE